MSPPLPAPSSYGAQKARHAVITAPAPSSTSTARIPTQTSYRSIAACNPCRGWTTLPFRSSHQAHRINVEHLGDVVRPLDLALQAHEHRHNLGRRRAEIPHLIAIFILHLFNGRRRRPADLDRGAERLLDLLHPVLGEKFDLLRIGSAEDMMDEMPVGRIAKLFPHAQLHLGESVEVRPL